MLMVKLFFQEMAHILQRLEEIYMHKQLQEHLIVLKLKQIFQHKKFQNFYMPIIIGKMEICLLPNK